MQPLTCFAQQPVARSSIYSTYPRPQHHWGPLAGAVDLRQISAMRDAARAHSQNGLCSRVGGLDVRLILPYSPAFRVAGLVCTHNGHEDMRTWLQASPYELRVACCAPGMSFAGWVHPYQGPGHRVAHGPVGQPSGIITILSNRSTLTCIVRRVRSYTVSLGLCGCVKGPERG